ncbi:MAG: helix-turn-helix domain-containing protein [Gordonia sp. (in: high G+C Gram-positive bacteria)]
MPFSEDCARFGDQLARLVDAGVPVKEAADAVGLLRGRCYAILRAIGRPAGQARGERGLADWDVIVAVFSETGSINQAAKASRVSHSVARKLLVAEGLVPSATVLRSKPEAKRRYLELIEQGWSVKRAAGEVGVNERTARDWRKGIRQIHNTRIYPDGRVVDYNTGTVYKNSR